MGRNVRGPYHIDKLARLCELAVYVRESHKLAELQARSGNNLREKLRQLMPGEKQWYKFLYYNRVFEADGKALMEELEAEVQQVQRVEMKRCLPMQQVASHEGSAKRKYPATERTITASDRPRRCRPTESMPETTDKRCRTQTERLNQLHELAVYIREPDKLAELRARSGKNLREKLIQRVPGEKRWYKFLYRNQVCGVDDRMRTKFSKNNQVFEAVLEELEVEVTRVQQVQQVQRVEMKRCLSVQEVASQEEIFWRLPGDRQKGNAERTATPTNVKRRPCR